MLCLYFHFTKQAIDSKALKPATDFFALARWSDDSTKWVHAWTQMVNRVRQSVWTRRIFIWGKRECTIVIGPQHESWNSRWKLLLHTLISLIFYLQSERIQCESWNIVVECIDIYLGNKMSYLHLAGFHWEDDLQNL